MPDFEQYRASLWSQNDENGERARETIPPIPQIEGGEPWRNERLLATWGHACAVVRNMSHKYQRFWDGAVIVLGDSKGTIQVTWRDELSRLMFEGAVMGGWEANGDHAGRHLLHD